MDYRSKYELFTSHNGHYRKLNCKILAINKLTLYKMFRRNNKTRKYQAPAAMVTQMALESNFCQTVRFNVQVNDLEHVNDAEDTEEVFYFDS